MEYYFLAWPLDVIDLDFKIIVVCNAEACSDVKLFKLLAEGLKFRMWHRAVRFRDKTGAAKENLWHNIRSFINAASVTTFLVHNSST